MRSATYFARRRPGDNRIGAVVLVKRFEDNDLVAGIYYGELRRYHGLGRPARDCYVSLRITVEAIIRSRLAGDGRAKFGDPCVIAY